METLQFMYDNLGLIGERAVEHGVGAAASPTNDATETGDGHVRRP
jgi:hypothetical protein